MIWKKIRRELQPYFQKNSLSTKMPHANKIVRKYVEQLRQHIDGPEFDVGPILKLLSFDVILEILLNATLEYPADEFKTLYESFQVSDDIAFEKMFKPWLANPIADFIFFRKEKNQFRECTNKFFKKVLEKQLNSPADKLEKAEEEEDEENKITFIKLLQKIKDMYVLEKNYVQSESIVMIAAGSVTTATTASFCLMMLAMHPDIQEKLYAEIMENFGDEDKDLSINDVHNLQYLDQVLKETERRYLIVPTLFRYVNEDTKMGSYIVPKGTTMMIAMKTIHMSSKYYKNPEKFDPEHFSPEAVENRPKFAFFPFSAGPRNCIGKALAELELKLILIHFVRTFKFTTSAKMEDLKLNFGAVIYSESGYHIKVQLRDSKKTQ